MNWDELKKDYAPDFTDQVMAEVKKEKNKHLSLVVFRWAAAACLGILLFSSISAGEWSVDGWLGLADFSEEIIVNVELNSNE